MKTLRQALEKEICREGIHMFKVVREGTRGFLSYTPTTYDERTVYSLEDLGTLSEEGFYIDKSKTNLSLLLLNAILNN
jgi:hypothetical protein